jgi:riboflavin biosynthesis pyrimidine reductase
MTNRPYCICHMASSIDGRLLVDRWSRHVDGSTASRVGAIYEATGDRLGGDAFLIGRASMAEFDGVVTGAPSAGEVRKRPSSRSQAASGNWAVVIDSQGKLRFPEGNVEGSPILCVLGNSVADAYLDDLRSKDISYVFAGDDGHDIADALREMRTAFGIERLLVEGGAVTNGYFLQAGLIDEFSVIMYPGIDGRAGGPAIVDAHVPADQPVHTGLRLRHTHTETLDDGFVWLRYTVEAHQEQSYPPL